VLKIGGDFVPTILRSANLRGKTTEAECPCHYENYQRFMKNESGPTALEWLKKHGLEDADDEEGDEAENE